MNDEQKSLCRRILEHYGPAAQQQKAIEELAELITALCHRMENRATDAAVIDELADVSIMVEQLANVYGRSRVEARIEDKLRRQLDRMEEEDRGRDL